MDLNNLSLDELLAQIKGDSGYQEAARQKETTSVSEPEPSTEAQEPADIDEIDVSTDSLESDDATAAQMSADIDEFDVAADSLESDDAAAAQEPADIDEFDVTADSLESDDAAAAQMSAKFDEIDVSADSLESDDATAAQMSADIDEIDVAADSLESDDATAAQMSAKFDEFDVTADNSESDDAVAAQEYSPIIFEESEQQSEEYIYTPATASSIDELLAQVSGKVDSAFGSADSVPNFVPDRGKDTVYTSKADNDDDDFSLNSLLSGYKKADKQPAEPIEVIGGDEFAPEFESIPDSVSYNPEPIGLVESDETEPQLEDISEPVSYNPEPIEIVDSDETEPQLEDISEPVSYSPEPIEIVDGDETQSDAYNGINIDVDIAGMFPTLGDDDNNEIVIEDPESDDTAAVKPEKAEKEQAEPKTIVLGDLGVGNAVFERPGIVTGRKMFGKTEDLRALPAILPADELLNDKYQSGEKTFVRTGNIPILAQQKPHTDEAQMLLPGFGETVEAEHVDEEKVENELRKNRSKKVGSFKLEGVENDEPQLDSEIIDELNESGGDGRRKGKRFSLTKTRVRLNKQDVEYNRPSDRATVYEYISRKKTIATVSAIISGICTLALLITTAFSSVSAKIDASFAPSFLREAPSTYLLALGLLLVAALAGLPSYISGITNFFNGSGKPNSQTPIFLSVAVAVIQTTLAIFLSSGEKLPVFALAAAMAVCLCSVGRRIQYSRVAQNFAFIVSRGKEGLFSIRTVDSTADAAALGQNTVIGEADVRYSGKAKFASNFLAYSLASDSADDLCVKLVPIVAAVSAVIGIIAGITTKNIMCGVSLFSGALCMGAPASASIAANLPLSSVNKKLRADGATVTSYASAFEYESTNAIAVDSTDLFPSSFCDIHGMKTFNGVRMDDAILTAASMLISAGGPISGLFNDVVMGRKELLMNVEELAYEDKLGLSGWIRGRRVFVGNRKLLENHNIDIPLSVDETRYRHDGRRVIYLADAGKISAIFVVSYGTDPRIAEHLRKIESNGINILIRTTDSNITEDFVSNCFGLPVNSVKIVSAGVSELLKSYSEKTITKADAKIIHNGSAAAFLHSVSAASSLCSTAGVVSTQQTFCTAAGLLLMAIIVIFSGAMNVTALQVCICQLVWLAIGIVLPLVDRE